MRPRQEQAMQMLCTPAQFEASTCARPDRSGSGQNLAVIAAVRKAQGLPRNHPGFPPRVAKDIGASDQSISVFGDLINLLDNGNRPFTEPLPRTSSPGYCW
jgi:hypothetical protein